MVYQANTKLKEVIKGFVEEYRRTAEASRNDYLKTLPAGARIPVTGKIYQSERESSFKDRAAEYRDKADNILDELLSDVHSAMTKAPTSDAANTISLLSSRSNVTRGEIDHLVETYGDNYQVYRSIQDIASKNGYRIPDHYLGKQEADLGNLKHGVDNILRYETAADHGDSFGVLCSFLGSQIDQVVTD